MSGAKLSDKKEMEMAGGQSQGSDCIQHCGDHSHIVEITSGNSAKIDGAADGIKRVLDELAQLRADVMKATQIRADVVTAIKSSPTWIVTCIISVLIAISSVLATLLAIKHS